MKASTPSRARITPSEATTIISPTFLPTRRAATVIRKYSAARLQQAHGALTRRISAAFSTAARKPMSPPKTPVPSRMTTIIPRCSPQAVRHSGRRLSPPNLTTTRTQSSADSAQTWNATWTTGTAAFHRQDPANAPSVLPAADSADRIENHSRAGQRRTRLTLRERDNLPHLFNHLK